MSSSDAAPQMSMDSDNTLWDKAKKEPFVPIGVAGTLAMVAYGLYGFKNRGNMKPSIYLMHLRVKSQSIVVGAITLGVTYKMIQHYLDEKKEK